jgi:short-subunit dehydrogenase
MVGLHSRAMHRVVLITGASSGIGAATARRFAEESRTELVLVARREERLRALAAEIGGATVIPADLTDPEAPARIAETVAAAHGGLHVLVNNAGAAHRATFAEGGYANVALTMELNFNAVVRLTESLLPLLRQSAPSAIVNVASTAGRVSRSGSGAYSASKHALCGWSDALHLEEAPNRVHVGLVLPGFIKTEGFPAHELTGHPVLRFIVGRETTVAEAILDCALHGRSERYAPRPYAIAAGLRVLAPALVRRALSGPRAALLATRTITEADSTADR